MSGEADMDLVFQLTVATVIALVVLLIGYSWYCGLFHSIKIVTKNSHFPKFLVAYKFATGNYSGCSSLFSEVAQLAPDLDCFGIYYDDPDEVNLLCLVKHLHLFIY